ncbi:efflux RND transporter periplasmic adaptor subunit [Stratiformator vulcanicus]|uniref:Multidrug resistance protein MdtA n=1 Tax=Stratiformator vulcanicus TaxID=2527980 RepID=A0A517QVJ3_9PLAN|nr:efflux RND transporter periplasmic adaptor subunit [Stratiformator vulcanicus]QDT35662.1 Multidrug resistance protein MdtA precursor [Stratiformator vulcanicus]
MTTRIVLSLLGGAAPIVAVVALMAVLSPPADATPEATGRPLPVETVTAERVASLMVQREFTGTIEASRESDLGFERGGRIVELIVDEGARVDTDDILGHVDTSHLYVRQKQVQADLAEARAMLTELVNGPRKQDIDAAAANLADANAKVALQRNQLERRKRLLERNVITREEFDEFRFGYQSMIAQRDAAAAALDELREGTRKEQVDAQRARVASLEASLESIAEDFKDAVLTAPFGGTIVRRNKDEGDVVAVGESVFRLIEDSVLELRVGVPAELAAGLNAGETVEVKVSRRVRNGTVKTVLPQVSLATRTQVVIIRMNLDDKSRAVVAGQIARLQLKSGKDVEGISIPRGALVRGIRGLWSCYVVEKTESEDAGERIGIVRRRDVELLDTHDDFSLVRGTISQGERVVTSGVHRVVPGQRVVIE